CVVSTFVRHLGSPLFPYTTLFRSGVEILVAQGTEAAAHCGEVSSMVLTPEVVSVARPLGVPVLTAGGVATGRQMAAAMTMGADRSEEHTSELQSLRHLVCRLLLEK